jgi:hypothetical protein
MICVKADAARRRPSLSAFGLGGMSMLGGGYTFSHLRFLCVFAAVLQAIGG